MILRYEANEETFSQENLKLRKNTRLCSIWTKTYPSLSFPLTGSVRLKFQIGTARNKEYPLTTATSPRAIFPGGAGRQYFSFCSKLPDAKAKFQVCADKGTSLPLNCHAQKRGPMLLLHVENTRAQIVLHSATLESRSPTPGKARLGDLRLPYIPPRSAQFLNWGWNTKRKAHHCLYYPIPEPEPKVKQALKPIALNLFQRDCSNPTLFQCWLCLQQSVKFKPKGNLKTLDIVVKDKWEEIQKQANL